jgi:predicted transcriptional regulator
MSSSILTVRVAPGVSERLQKLAEATKRSKSFLAAEAIEEYLVVQEWQVNAILEGIEAADRGDGVDLDQVRQRWEKHIADSSDSSS